MAWSVVFLDERVWTELDALPNDIRASFLRITRLIASHGLERVREPYVKHLEGRLWEMRLKGKDGIARAVYITAAGRRVVVIGVVLAPAINSGSQAASCTSTTSLLPSAASAASS